MKATIFQFKFLTQQKCLIMNVKELNCMKNPDIVLLKMFSARNYIRLELIIYLSERTSK
jgi:hypothetical protein